jgi:hypothetical protein
VLGGEQCRRSVGNQRQYRSDPRTKGGQAIGRQAVSAVSSDADAKDERQSWRASRSACRRMKGAQPSPLEALVRPA